MDCHLVHADFSGSATLKETLYDLKKIPNYSVRENLLKKMYPNNHAKDGYQKCTHVTQWIISKKHVLLHWRTG